VTPWRKATTTTTTRIESLTASIHATVLHANNAERIDDGRDVFGQVSR
jgi:hypothetical protein